MKIAPFLEVARDFKKIKAWILGKRLVVEIYSLSKALPHHEIFGLVSQIRRAAISVVSNIAEGASRQHKKEYLHFLYIAKSSLSEVECLLIMIEELNYLTKENLKTVVDLYHETGKTLLGLIQAIKKEI